MRKYFRQTKRLIIQITVFVLLITGCNIPQSPPIIPTLIRDSLQQITPENAEPAPTLTPVPDPKKVLLVTGADANQGIVNILRSSFQTLSENLFQLSEMDSLTPDQLPENVDTVIFPKTPADIGDFVQRFPQIQFITVDPAVQSYSNVWTIQYDPGFQFFLAGYAVAITSYDWRGAGLLSTDIEHSDESFINGAHYFCGRCMPNIAPFVEFPLTVMLPSTASPEEWGAGIDQIQPNYVRTYYVSEEAASDALYQKLLTMDVSILGVNDPPAGLEGKWLAAIKIDLAGSVIKILEMEQPAEQPGIVVPELIVKSGSIGGSFNEGKKAVLEEVYTDLISGMVSPYNPVPAATYEK